MKNSFWMLITAMGLSLTACGAEEEPVAEEPSAEETVAEEPAAEPAVGVAEEPVAEVEPGEDEFPIAEDFEEETAEAITPENYDEVLTQIEADLAATE